MGNKCTRPRGSLSTIYIAITSLSLPPTFTAEVVVGGGWVVVCCRGCCSGGEGMYTGSKEM